MQLDRNKNTDGTGKYALINLRKVAALEKGPRELFAEYLQAKHALRKLDELGVITWGTESPGDQFFVMKYKDKFTAAGLEGYVNAIEKEAMTMPINEQTGEGFEAVIDLTQFATELLAEIPKAKAAGNQLPT